MAVENLGLGIMLRRKQRLGGVIVSDAIRSWNTRCVGLFKKYQYGIWASSFKALYWNDIEGSATKPKNISSFFKMFYVTALVFCLYWWVSCGTVVSLSFCLCIICLFQNCWHDFLLFGHLVIVLDGCSNSRFWLGGLCLFVFWMLACLSCELGWMAEG